jgi:hypothetical protein
MKTQQISRKNLKLIHDIACFSWKKKLEEYASRNHFDEFIEFTENEVNEMFAASDEKQKIVLSKFFKQEKNIIERVKSFEDACNVLNVDQNGVFSLQYDTPNDIAYKKLKTIIKALNEGWYPDFTKNDYKYYNWFEIKSGVFSYYYTYFNISNMNVPSALYLKSEGLAKHAIKIALREYEILYM